MINAKLGLRAKGKMSAIPIGTRVQMSKLGAARCPGLAKKQGIVVSGSRNPSTVSVQFDGNSLRTRTMLHMDYIEPIRAFEEIPR